MGQLQPEKLTKREREALALLRRGLTNKQIATALVVDVRTAEFHVANVLAKLGLPSRAHVAAYLLDRDLEKAQIAGEALPAFLTSFVGREWEVATLRMLLQRSRLLTVIGPGGIGKTRLAIEAARTLDRPAGEGPWFIDLAPLADENLIVSVMLSALGLREEPDRTAEETLLSALRNERHLLLIDNCEHVVGRVSPIVRDILSSCSGIQVLATSRTRLGVIGEVLLPLDGLRLSGEPGPEGALGADSVRLFLDRAHQVRPTYEPSFAELEDISALCRILEGIPLAIELAAARMTGIAPREMRERLEGGQTLLATSSKAVPQRHKTIDAAIGWSYSLLTLPKQAVFRRLSVCAGFDLEAAEAICGADPNTRDEIAAMVLELVDNSLIVAHSSGVTTRYRMLEPTRQYAQRRLSETKEEQAARHKHAQHFANLAAREVPWAGEPLPNWVEIVEAEQDNLRRALAHAAAIHDLDDEVRLLHTLQRFWSLRGQLAEAKTGVEHALSVTEGSRVSRQRILILAADLFWRLGEAEDAIRLATEAVSLAKLFGLGFEELSAMNTLGNAQDAAHHPEDAVATYKAAADLARSRGDDRRLALVRHNLALSLIHSGHWTSAHSPLNQAEAYFRQAGDAEGMLTVLQSQGVLAFAAGNHDLAARHWFEVLRLGRQLGDRYQVDSALEGLAQWCIKSGDAQRGLRLSGAAAGIRAATGLQVDVDHPNLDEWLARGRSALSNAAADLAWRQGVQMSYEEAIQCALEADEERKTATRSQQS